MIWTIIVFMTLILGLLFLGIELFLIPGFGFFGFTGIGLMVGAIALSFTMLSPIAGILVTIGAVFFTLTSVLYFPKTKLAQKLILNKNLNELPKGNEKREKDFDFLIGSTGITLTYLRPSGKVLIDDEKYDAISRGDFIPNNSEVTVISTHSQELIVKLVKTKNNLQQNS